jgi:hypothetical protein
MASGSSLPRAGGGQQRGDLLGTDRPCVQEARAAVAGHGPESLRLLLVFDALGDGAQS